MGLLGAQLMEVGGGRCVIELPYRDALGQQDGFFHAGVMTTIADSAGGYAAYSLMPAGSRVLATEFKMNFLRPGAGERAIAIGTVVKPGKTLTVCDLEVWVERDEARHLCVKGLQTCIRA